MGRIGIGRIERGCVKQNQEVMVSEYHNNHEPYKAKMVNLYATLIINKRRTFDQVPEKFKADVEAKLLEYGYDTNGDLIAEEE